MPHPWTTLIFNSVYNMIVLIVGIVVMGQDQTPMRIPNILIHKILKTLKNSKGDFF